LTGITIHKKSSIGDGSKTVIKAKDGKLVSSEQSVSYISTNDGYYYEDLVLTNTKTGLRCLSLKVTTKIYLNIDLSQLNKVNVDDENIANQHDVDDK
jgi:lipopolysaccharide export system permease protein